MKFFKFLLNHPLNKANKLRAITRYLRWQLGSRLVQGSVAVDFVEDARLLVELGMTGATGNIYTGLHEYEDMAFVLHALRRDDFFVDIGANIGSYTVLATKVAGAAGVAIEPIPATFKHLQDNIYLNGLVENVKALNIGVGSEDGELMFTSDRDTVNHVLSAEEEDDYEQVMRVPVQRLDDVLGEVCPTVIKIDVEGFETKVIEGAGKTLNNPALLAVLMELNGSGDRYGFDEVTLHDTMLKYEFTPCIYEPRSRTLDVLSGRNIEGGNTLYIRDMDKVNTRLQSSRKYNIGRLGMQL